MTILVGAWKTVMLRETNVYRRGLAHNVSEGTQTGIGINPMIFRQESGFILCSENLVELNLKTMD